MCSERWDTFNWKQLKVSIFTGPIYLFIPFPLLLTIVSNLYGTRAKNNPVKKIEPRKADQERQSADSVCDAKFRITLEINFLQLGESHKSIVRRFSE